MRFIVTITTFVLLLFPNMALAELRDLPHITILAASSLSDPMTELVRRYSRAHDITVTVSYDTSSEQAYKIERGQAADLFISSHTKWMQDLKQKGLIDVYSLTNLMRNNLFFVASKRGSLARYIQESKEGEVSMMQRALDRTVMVISNPEDTPLGLYTKQALFAMDPGLWQQFEPAVMRSDSAKKVLYLIAKGNTAGVVYASDAYKNEEVEALFKINPELHDPIIYQAVVVAGENMEPARDFLNFLTSDYAKSVFRKHGFVVD